MFIERVLALSDTTNGEGGVFAGAIEFGDFILLGISVIIFLGFLLSIIFILWGGLLLILSGGKEEKTKPAINTIRFSVLGIFISVAAIFIAPIIGNMLGMEDLADKYFSPTAIYERIGRLGNKMFTGGHGNYGGSDTYDGRENKVEDLEF